MLRWIAPQLLLAAIASPAAIFAQEDDRSVLDGVYTAEQAERGSTVWVNTCLECHDQYEFEGENFTSLWTEVSLRTLYRRIYRTMPDDNPGGLERAEYADVVAYILSLNGYPTGSEELPADDGVMRSIRVDPPSH
jgi:hypothetical protein